MAPPRPALLIILLFLVLWLLSPPLLVRRSPVPAPRWAWAPGYWELSPVLGVVRIVPLAPAVLVNPPAAAAPPGLPLRPMADQAIPLAPE